MFIIDVRFVDLKVEIGDLATWVGAIGTILTLIFAFFQLSSDRKKARDIEKKSQATKVSVWIYSDETPGQTSYSIQNISDLPIYKAIITLVGIQGAGLPRDGKEVNDKYRVNLVTIPPGKFFITSLHGGGAVMGIKNGVEIAFTDSSNNHWVRRSNGQLKEINKNALDFYKCSLPVTWSKLDDEKPTDVKDSD